RSKSELRRIWRSKPMITKKEERAPAYWIVACSLLIGNAACSAVAEPESNVLNAPLVANVPLAGAGFIHAANKSKFRLGANPAPTLEFGLCKLVGSEGVFATVPETGWVLAIPNARAPSTLTDPLTRSPEVHNQTVVDYFIGAGLPADQVGGVTAHASV